MIMRRQVVSHAMAVHGYRIFGLLSVYMRSGLRTSWTLRYHVCDINTYIVAAELASLLVLP